MPFALFPLARFWHAVNRRANVSLSALCITLTYTNGRREDTAKRENVLMIDAKAFAEIAVQIDLVHFAKPAAM